MIAVANNRIGNNAVLLPPRVSPYLLRDVYELIQDECRSELVLQWSEGFLSFRADEDADSLDFDFHPGKFKPSAKHGLVSSELMPSETEVLRELIRAPKTKQQLGATAKLLGAATRPDFGKQGGGLLRRGMIRDSRLGREVQYEITATGRRALAAALWKSLLGKECGWTWVAVNQQGFCDSVMLSFDGVVPTVLLHVIASSIEILSITRS
jgi:hypothetical protein